MSLRGCLLREDELQCSIFLSVFMSPVTLPCAHNFCRSCITTYFNMSAACHCPLCMEQFHQRPALRINLFISEMSSRLRQSGGTVSQRAQPGDVCCEECGDAQVKAVKSCVECLSSFCETHLKPHRIVTGLKRHTLLQPVRNLEDRICPLHDKPLELFCRTDRTSICTHCTYVEHQAHLIVPLKDESERRKLMLGRTEGRIHQMTQERTQKIQELTRSAGLSKDAVDRAMAAGLQVFTDLGKVLDRGLAQFIQKLEEDFNTSDQQSKGFIAELQQEVRDLDQREKEVVQLSRSEDHFHLFQTFSSLNTAPPTKEWTEVRVPQPLYEQTLRRTLVGALDLLQETFRREKKKLLEDELRRAQQHEAEVTLDPQTASPWLILSEDRKRVSLGHSKKTLPDKPERFSPGGGVLGEQSFSSGRFYFEVQVEEKSRWDVGVVTESINRKGKVTKSQEGGFWILSLKKGNEFTARSSHDVPLSLTWNPQKVGVFVDHDDGLVSFYDVDAADLIYSFTDCSFTERLRPFLSPGHTGISSTPLIITPVNHSTPSSSSLR